MNEGIEPAAAKRFYDGFGEKQDRQGWYEDPAIERLLELGRFGEASRIFEIGHGTGRIAETLLRDKVAETCRYTGSDVSETMHRLAVDRLAPWGERVQLRLTSGSPQIDDPDETYDRFIATYVLDLMTKDALPLILAEAWRVVAPGGLLCVVSLTDGRGPVTGFVSWLWERVQAMAPEKVGGCRPISPRALLEATDNEWIIRQTEVICRFGVCSEVTVAEKAAG